MQTTRLPWFVGRSSPVHGSLPRFGKAVLQAALLLGMFAFAAESAEPLPKIDYTVETTWAREGFDGKRCWVHARAGVVPAAALGKVAPGEAAQSPMVVMTLQELLLTGSDVFFALNVMRTSDFGRTWDGPTPQPVFQRQALENGQEVVVCDFTPHWHAASGVLLGLGHTAYYQGAKLADPRTREIAYATFDLKTGFWRPWKTLELPDAPEFQNAGAGCVQRLDLPNGELLIPISHRTLAAKRYDATVLRCRFDGERLTYVNRGDDRSVAVGRGLYEPSLATLDGRMYMTLRNDAQGYYCEVGDDLKLGEPIPWTFDDGQPIGNYNTQQHWVSHPQGLFLVYTRRGAANDHVFRHRAPLFMARFDPVRRCLLRATEQAVVPERGARLGNFGVTKISDQETWITAAEWMQPIGVEKRGSNNRVWISKIQWKSAPER